MSADVITITGIRPGLDIRGLDRGQVPQADWICVYGFHERARGADAVRALCARANSGHCPHTNEIREAA